MVYRPESLLRHGKVSTNRPSGGTFDKEAIS